jgi:hypothetical protein
MESQARFVRAIKKMGVRGSFVHASRVQVRPAALLTFLAATSAHFYEIKMMTAQCQLIGKYRLNGAAEVEGYSPRKTELLRETCVWVGFGDTFLRMYRT